jgi:hypothetical protein
MKRFSKALVGLLTLMPIAWAAICAVRVVQWWTGALFEPDEVMLGGDAARITSEHFAVAMKGGVGVAALTVALLVAFLMHASSSPRIADDQRGLWSAVLILGAGFTLPVYWWVNVWAATAPRQATVAGGQPGPAAPEVATTPLWQPSL